MIKVKREGIILEPRGNGFESRAVLNPAIYQEGKKLRLIYRAVDKKHISSLGYALLNGPLKIVERWSKPLMSPKHSYEKKGLEDPRVVKIGDVFYMTYVAHDGKNALIAYAYGSDLFKLKRGGLISPKLTYSKAGKLFKYSRLKDDYYFFESFYKNYGGQGIKVWHKDGFLFPQKIDDKFVLAHRILPDMQLVYFHDFNQLKDEYFWIDYLMSLSKYVVLEGAHGFEARHVGGGAPPVKTKYGWLMIYHGVEETNRRRIYCAGAALFSLDHPRKLIARLPYPLFSPEEDYEVHGSVNRVVFPTGTAIFNNRLYIYYGAADSRIAVVSVGLNALLKELLKNKIKY
jgi:beta-1,2-mannobiose phosphorylase / 1,2-beta-oligomannan phosphorylase